MHLTLSEDGAYRRLIDEYMVTRSPLPDNDAALARIIGISINEFQAIAEQMRGFFKAKGGRLHHRRCNTELDRQDTLSQKRSESAKKGAAKRHTRSRASKQLPSKILLQDRTGQEKTGEKKDSLSDKSDLDPDFIALWDNWEFYKTPKGPKKKAEEEWGLYVRKAGVDPAIVLKAAKAYCRQCEKTDTSTQHVHRWIRDHRWQDDYATEKKGHPVYGTPEYEERERKWGI